MEKSDNLPTTHAELYLQEIEGIDDYWGPTFRAIYELDEHVEFRKKIDERIRNHDKDIERLCNFYYQGFIDAIRELIQVRTQAKKLNNEVITIDENLQTAAQNIIEKSGNLLQARRVEGNIVKVINQLSMCLPVLTAYEKLQRQMSEKRYYPALKTLEQLEHLHLPHVADYRFSFQMKESIPKLRENIKNASMSDLKDFLESIRKHSPKIGEVAMKHTAEQLANDPRMGGRKKKKISPVIEEITEDELSAQEMIDFSPVYRCLHIYTVLGSRGTFESYYRAQRSSQAALVLQPPANMHETLESYRVYIHAIVGFFIVEDHIFNTGNGLVSKTFLDDMWTMALSKIVNALRTHTAYCTDATLMLKIKNLIMLFSTTLRNYGYNVKLIWELLLEIRDHYNEVLMQRWVQVFREILDQENFLPIQVTNQQEFDAILSSFPYETDNTKITFPYRFPFSHMVPKVYSQVKEFIYACLKFSEDLHLSQVEIVEMIRKSINLLLTHSFSGSLSYIFRSPSIGLLQIIQIIVDTGYLEGATVYLEEFVSNITGDGNRINQSQTAMFRVAREDAERQICEKLRCKLDEFFDLENYDWLLVEPQGHASSFITDLIAFLQSIFQSFTNLPPQVAQVACKSACEHIANSMLALMLNEEIKQASLGAFHQINLDVLQCEQFAASEPVAGLQPDDLLQYFTPLRQLLDLFTTRDWSTYFHDYGHENSKYQKVNSQQVIILLEKLREADKKNMFSVLKKSERDKKKLLETVLKQLKQLAQTQQQSN
ncbi:exocyst complex component 6 isoform X2 [Chrysoperla carnea]|uniref:exocyst complex component 6 isoform X2 n=1 Tax=Chrysoperla carnea TaxID=189513 RepID=UPI001D0731E3|nr:exocyst complex component 6 isoform X2 [Chrysoperla carnea]